MTSINDTPTPNPDHYEQCPQYANPNAPSCHCEGINQADENYWTEPPSLTRSPAAHPGRRGFATSTKRSQELTMTSCLPTFLVSEDLRTAGHHDSTRGTAWRPGFRAHQASPRTVRLWHDGPDEGQHLDQYATLLRRAGYYATVEHPAGKRPRVRVTRP